jgi:c-di-GMP-binding flagellar brake protein YcgR
MQKKRAYSKFYNFRRNQFAELVVFDPDRGKISLRSRVLEVDADSLVLLWPEEDFGSKYFFRGVRFGVLQLVCGTEVLAFKVDIPSTVTDDFSSGRLRFSLPSFLDSVDQKRLFERIKACIPVRFRIMNNLEEGYSDLVSKGDSIDLSIGGMELSTTELMEPGSELELSFTLEFFDFRAVVAKVLRRSESMEFGNPEYRYSVEFLGMFERDRTTLGLLLMKKMPALPSPRVVSG